MIATRCCGVSDDMLAGFDVEPDRLPPRLLTCVADLTRRGLVPLFGVPASD